MTIEQLDKLHLSPGESVELDVFVVYIMTNKSNKRHYLEFTTVNRLLDRSYIDFVLEAEDPVCEREYKRLSDARRTVNKLKKEFEKRTDGVILGLGIEKRSLLLTACTQAYYGTNKPLVITDKLLDSTDVEYTALN